MSVNLERKKYSLNDFSQCWNGRATAMSKQIFECSLSNQAGVSPPAASLEPVELDDDQKPRMTIPRCIASILGVSGGGKRARMEQATYASEPQLRVRDFCLSLSDLYELQRALNFPSRTCHL